MQVIALGSSQVRLKGNQPQSFVSKNPPRNVWGIEYRDIAKLGIIYDTVSF